MSFVGDLIGDITGANQAADAAKEAAATQAAAAQAGVNKTDERFLALQKMLQPFVDTGTSAFTSAGNLIGLGGSGAQSDAIAALQNSPEMAALVRQGEDAILAQASATGGLRGGNTAAALAQFRPQILSQLISQQFSRLGGLGSIGQNAAAGVGNAGLQSAGNIASLLQQQGAATAGGQLAAGQTGSSAFGTLAGLGGLFIGAGGVPGLKKLF